MARKRSESDGIAENEQTQFPPERIRQFLHRVKCAIGQAESRTVGLNDLEQLTGRPAGTIGSWCDGVRMQQVEFLLAALERIPERLRNELIEATCRTHPTLQHFRLAHDPIAVSQLENLLKQRAGLTVIHGGPEHVRAFVINALGNSLRAVAPVPAQAQGLDLQMTDAWAPVPGVQYLPQNKILGEDLHPILTKFTKAMDGTLILLNGVWNQIPHSHSSILTLAARCHVVIADDLTKPEEIARRLSAPFHMISVSPARENPEWIRVIFRASQAGSASRFSPLA